MNLPKVVSRDEWTATLREFLVKEKEATRARDALSAARRELPMVEIDKDYVFEGPAGKGEATKNHLADLFQGRRQLIVYHFMFGPDWDAGCPACSFLMDNLSQNLTHLNQRDTTFAVVSRAPVEKLDAYRKRMGWDFDWYSSEGSDFNYDFHVTLDDRVAPVEYNFGGREVLEQAGMTEFKGVEIQGISVFLRDDDRIFHTYSSFARGTEVFLQTFFLLDITALGRQEAWEKPEGRYTGPWKTIARHDEYPD